MPGRRGGVLRVRGKVTNVAKVNESLNSTRNALGDINERAVRDLGQTAVGILQGVAPSGRSNALQRGIKARRVGIRGIDITVHAISPESGYDYAAVTRFGHQVEEIFPTEERKALLVRWQSGGSNFRSNVRGFQPSGDWVDKGLPLVLEAADEAARQMGRELELRLFS